MKCANPEFLELSKEILGQGLILRFQATGWSMFPAVRDGDILCIRPATPDEIKPHDIIFYRTEDSRLIVHRVRKKILSGQGIVFETKGDFCWGKTEVIPFENVLGTVRDIQRNGRSIDICHGSGKFNDRFCFLMSPLIKKTRDAAGRLLHCIQGLGFYRSLAKKLIHVNIIYDRILLEDCEEHIVAKVKEAVIGETMVNKFTDDDGYRGWWIFGMWVHWRYRRMGIGRQLTDIASRIVVQKGAGDVKLFVFQDNRAALTLYKTLGFYQISIPQIDAELHEEARETGRLRIIMKKDL